MHFKNKKEIESKNKLDFNSSKVKGIWYENMFSTLKVKMILLILSIIIPAVSLLVYFTTNLQKLYITEVEQTTTAVLRSEVISLEQIAEGSRFLLVALSKDPMLTGADSIALNAHYTDILKQLPMNANIFAIKPNGDIFASATPLLENTNVSDRLYFKEVIRTHAFSFGEYQIGRITKIPVIASAYPVLDKNGNLLAIVGTSLDLKKINLEMEKILPNNKGTLIVSDNNGTILLWSPDIENKWMGKTIPEDDISMTILRKGEGVKEIKGSDGIERIYSFGSIKSSNGKIFVSYSIPQKEALSNININFYTNLIWLSLVLIIFIIVLIFIRKLMEKTDSQIIHLNNILESVHKVDVLLLHERNFKLIMDEVCKILSQTTGYVLVWIGSTEEKDKRVVSIARAGERSDYLDKIFITWDDSDFGLGPTGTAIKTRQVQSCRDIATAKYFKPWIKNALERGLASTVSLPIIYNEKIFGVLTVYSDQIGFFNEHEIRLLEDISNNIAFTLHHIEIEINSEQFKDNLKKSETLLKETEKISKTGGWEYNIEKKKLIWSDEVYSIHELPLDYVPNIIQTNAEFYDLNSKKIIQSAFNNAVENGESYDLELPFITAKGNNLWVHIIGQVEFSGGKPARILGKISDITQKKNNELKNFELENRTESILNSIGDAVVAYDKNGTIVLFNKKAEELTNQSMNVIIGNKYNEIMSLIDSKNKDITNEIFKKSLSTNNVMKIPIDTMLLRKDGHKIPIADSISPIKNNAGQIIGSVMVFRDATSERELEQSKNDFISITSHQLRTPLSATKWVLETLFNDQDPTVKQNEKYKYLTISNERLIKLVNRLLNVTKIESGKLVVNKKITNLNNLINDLVDSLNSLANKKNKTIKVNIPINIKDVYCDPILINESLENLLTNAFVYSNEDSKEISLNVEDRKDDYLISVHNEGYIDATSAEKINLFDKFLRGSKSLKIEPSGSGLGLYITKKMIEASGGNIWFESNIKTGTTFYLTIIKENI